MLVGRFLNILTDLGKHTVHAYETIGEAFHGTDVISKHSLQVGKAF